MFRTLRSLLLTLCVAALLPAAALAKDKDSKESKDEGWKPVSPAELAETAPVVEKDADAEVVVWENRVQGGIFPPTVTTQYLRIKVFTERGAKLVSQVDLPYVKAGPYPIADVAARTIKPDGTVVEVAPDAIFDRTIVKANGVKVNAKSFALPAVVPGSIVEYRWKETSPWPLAFYTQLVFQRDLPVREAKYYIRAETVPGVGMRMLVFRAKTTSLTPEADGFYSTSATNVPAYFDEPFSPPQDEIRAWMLIYPSLQNSPEDFWTQVGRNFDKGLQERVKVNDDVKKAAAAATAGAGNDAEKVERLFRFVRSSVKNVDDDASGYTPDELKKVKENKSPADTLKRAQGTRSDVTRLFVALASAAGLDARVAIVADRSVAFFKPEYTSGYFMRTQIAAVWVGDGWHFYDPGNPNVPFNMLRWAHEGQQALLNDPVNPPFVETPFAGPERSVEKRSGALRLSDDGTIEGDLRVEYTGHLAMDRREAIDQDTPQQREETITAWVKERLSNAEVTNVTVENLSDAEKPLVYAFHVRAAGYAQRTGKRLFVQPAVFEHGLGPVFAAPGRRNPIYFHYPWIEHDAITIEAPAGFAFEPPAAAEKIADNGSTARYSAEMKVSDDKRTLEYRRDFSFGTPGKLLAFAPTAYFQLKQAFDGVHDRDGNSVSLTSSGN